MEETGRATVLETERLILRKFTTDDAAFMLELLNEPSFLHNIGDKGVKTVDEAVSYIQTGPMASYQRFGFGVYLVELKETGAAIGLCGLIKRDELPDVDVGFAFLPAYWSRGYASEAAAAVVDFGKKEFGIQRIVAIARPDNTGSIRVLERLKLRFDRLVDVFNDGSELSLFVPDETFSTDQSSLELSVGYRDGSLS